MENIIDLAGLIRTLSAWMIGLIPAAGGLMVMYHAVMKAVSSDEHAAMQHGRSIKNVLMYSAVALGASGLVNLIISFVHTPPH